MATAHDMQLRRLLKAHLAPTLASGDMLIDELGLELGRHRADLVRVGAADVPSSPVSPALPNDPTAIAGLLEGFEIKAGRDSLNRLHDQIDAYDAVFDRCWIVTTPVHCIRINSAGDILPPGLPRHWGVLVARMRDPDWVAPWDPDFSDSDEWGNAPCVLDVIRPALRHGRRKPLHLASLLWRDEALAKLQALGLTRGLLSKPKRDLYAALVAEMSLPDLAAYVRCCLLARTGWRQVQPEGADACAAPGPAGPGATRARPQPGARPVLPVSRRS